MSILAECDQLAQECCAIILESLCHDGELEVLNAHDLTERAIDVVLMHTPMDTWEAIMPYVLDWTMRELCIEHPTLH